MKTLQKFALLAVLLLTFQGFGQKLNDTVDNPLQEFSRLIGGEWHLGDSYQTFEWGVGKKSVKAKGYFKTADGEKLVSEGIWFLHPQSGEIKGYFTAIDMGVDFFEYTTRFEGDKMVNKLISYSKDGTPTHYKEIWEFTGDGQYSWTLYSTEGDELMKVMGGEYERK